MLRSLWQCFFKNIFSLNLWIFFFFFFLQSFTFRSGHINYYNHCFVPNSSHITEPLQNPLIHPLQQTMYVSTQPSSYRFPIHQTISRLQLFVYILLPAMSVTVCIHLISSEPIFLPIIRTLDTTIASNNSVFPPSVQTKPFLHTPFQFLKPLFPLPPYGSPLSLWISLD